MRVAAAVALAFVTAAAAHAGETEPVVRDCSTRAYGDLGRGWQRRAVVAGPLAFVGLRDGYRNVPPARRRAAWPLKVLVVIDPRAVVTVAIASRSRRHAALRYATTPLPGTPPVPLAAGSTSTRFEACARPNAGAEPWNHGTQFPGYFLVSGRRCVTVDVRVARRAAVLRRTLRFGVARCPM